MKRNKGFTLIELMVVIFIIAMLAGLVIVNLARSKMKARDARRKADLYDVASAIELYYSQKHKFPGDPNQPYQVCTGITDEFRNDYLSKPPYDPLTNGSCPGGYDYGYLYMKTDSGKYCLYAKLENDRDKDINTGESACGTPGGYNYFIEK